MKTGKRILATFLSLCVFTSSFFGLGQFNVVNASGDDALGVEDTVVKSVPTQFPSISHNQTVFETAPRALNIRATVSDIIGLDSVKMYYKTPIQNNYTSLSMKEIVAERTVVDSVYNSVYESNIQTSVLFAQPFVQYYFEATDSFNTQILKNSDGNDFIINLSNLYITEMVANPSGETDSADAFEFIEIYNGSNHRINLKDYKLMYEISATDIRTTDIDYDAFIEPGQAVPIWIYNGDSINLCGSYIPNNPAALPRFRKHYNMLENAPVYTILGMGTGRFNLQNSGVKSAMIARDGAVKPDYISRATYDGAKDAAAQDKAVIYACPRGNTYEMTKLGSGVIATPGKVTAEQKQINYDDPKEPVIIHQIPVNNIEAAPVTIAAVVTDETELRTVKLYYETNATPGVKQVAMVIDEQNKDTFTYTIPYEDIVSSSYIKYYIEASDSLHIVTSPTNKATPNLINIVDKNGPQINIISPVDKNCFNNYYRPVISASFTDTSGINYDSVKLYLNDEDITSKATISNNIIKYVPAADLMDGKYIVKIEVADNNVNNNKTTKMWSFSIKTLDTQLGPKIPDILITELCANPVGDTNPNDLYEFVELYNASNKDINIGDYRMMYFPYEAKPEDIRSSDITDNYIIAPGQTAIIWVYNLEAKTVFKTTDSDTLDDATRQRVCDAFRRHYNLPFSTPIFLINGDSATRPGTFNLHNTEVKTIMVAKDAVANEPVTYISTATYNDDPDSNDVVSDKSIIYTYLTDGSNKMVRIRAGVHTTPGSITYQQKPLNYYDTTAPVIWHQPITGEIEPATTTISAVISDETEVRVANLYYETFNTNGMVSIEMKENTSKVNTYEVDIPVKDILGSSYIKYYIQTTDGMNIVKSTEYIINVIDNQGPRLSKVYPSDKFYLSENRKPCIIAEYTDSSLLDLTSVRLYLNDVDITAKATITEKEVSYLPNAELVDGEYIVKIELSDKSVLRNKTVKTWSFIIGQPKYNYYVGQIHSHSAYSDGSGTPDEAYSYARDTAKVDFFGLTDHGHYLTEGKWKELTDVADNYNSSDRFATIPGFEMTWNSSTGWWGHINSFNTGWVETRLNNTSVSLPNYYNNIARTQGSISQFNHPNSTWGDFGGYEYYSEDVDEVMDLMEVVTAANEVEYARALDKGWHISPTNNEDNHNGEWAKTLRGTVVLAPRLTRENILEALHKNRTYSAGDRNLKLMYTINGEIMGSRLQNPEKLSISIEASHPTNTIKSISIISDGRSTVATKQFSTNDVNWTLELPATNNYYYVKVDYTAFAYSAPIWVENSKPLVLGDLEFGFDELDIDNPSQIRADISNVGNLPIENIKVEIFKNDTLEANKLLETTLAAIKENYKDSMQLGISDLKGARNIYVKVSGKMGDRDVVDIRYISVPELIITEVLPNASKDADTLNDAYEFVEVYNATNSPVDIKDYRLEWLSASGSAIDPWDITVSKSIQPRSSLIIWIKPNEASAIAKTLTDFNKHYGTNLTDDQVVEFTGKLLDDTAGRTLFISRDGTTIEKLSQARYNFGTDLNLDTQENLSIQYKYSRDGTDLVKKITANTKPTPGAVTPEQVPFVNRVYDIATLKTITVDGTPINGFDSSNTEYQIVLPVGTTEVPKVEVETTVADAVYSIVPATTLPGTTVINVVAKDGVNTKEYRVKFTVESKGDSGSGGTIIPPNINVGKVEDNTILLQKPEIDATTGEVKIVVDGKLVKEAIQNADADNEGIKEINIIVPNVEKAKSYSMAIASNLLTEKYESLRINIKTDIGNIILPSNMLANITDKIAETITFKISKADIVSLPENIRNEIGNRPVVNLSVLSDGKVVEYNNPDAAVTVSLPYVPTKQELEKPEHIVVWYIDGSGIAWPVPNGKYDASKGCVVFTTSHFSKYAVTYVTKTFDDIVDYGWAKEQIEVLASRGVINGISSNLYSPEANIKRADFILLLVKAMGLTARFDNNFDDVKTSDYYYEALGIAKKLGLVKGVDGKTFNPESNITRQEMFVIVARVLRETGKINYTGSVEDLAKFTDNSEISDYAISDIATLVKGGIIKGSGNMVNPLSNTTRAEAAVLLYNIIK